DIARHAVVLTPLRSAATSPVPDAGDQLLWDLLASRGDLVLVTGGKLVLQDEAMQQRVILPRTFATQLRY
ncbi:MAG: hypothetical protein LH479_08750, partial [Polaromonas sp.]|nr:hypothetical protein [Polaromonas sp.]